MRDLPEISLDGFEPSFGCGEYTWGPAVDYDGTGWKDHQYHAEMLGWFYHDYLGTHCFAQVWDYTQQGDPDQRWQMVLLLHRPTRIYDDDGCITGATWAWQVRIEYDDLWKDGGPGYAKVGADVDQWLQAPESLRFIIENN